MSLRQFRQHFLGEEVRQAYWAAGNVHGTPAVSVRIPGWEPVTLDEGAQWMGHRIENGWYVGYRVCASRTDVTIWMKYWEYGDVEPEFPSEACD